jgi:hypothetical protein
MNYILFGITALLFLVLFAFLDARKKKKQILKTLKDNWGKEKTEVINFDKASWYSTYAKEQAFHVLSQQTTNTTKIFFNYHNKQGHIFLSKFNHNTSTVQPAKSDNSSFTTNWQSPLTVSKNLKN